LSVVPAAADTLESVIRRWVDDPESDVVYAELVEGRWAVRMTQTVRDATTVWWEIGDRSVRAEAYVLPAPAHHHEAVYRLALVRNASAWRAHFCLDAEGALVLRGRLAVGEVEPLTLDLMLGEIYELVELSFRPLAGLAFTPALRETNS
jgi:hypothetical protein